MFAYMLPIFYTVLQIIVLITVGFSLRRFAGWGEGFFKNLSTFVIKVVLPVYLFVRIAPSSPEDLKTSWIFPVAAVVIGFLCVGTGSAVFLLSSLERRQKRVGIALAGFGNSGYMPLSIIEFFPLSLPAVGELFGVQEPYMYVAAYLLVQSPLIWTMGNYLISGKGVRPKLREIITPPFVSICVSFLFVVFVPGRVLTDMSLPSGHLFSALERLGDITLPLILISLGAMIGSIKTGSIRLREALKMAVGTSTVRFLLLPGLYFGAYFLFLRRLSLSPAQNWVLFLESVTPPSLTLSIMVNHAGIRQENTAFSMLVTYILYLLIFPFFMMLFLSLPEIRAGLG